MAKANRKKLKRKDIAKLENTSVAMLASGSCASDDCSSAGGDCSSSGDDCSSDETQAAVCGDVEVSEGTCGQVCNGGGGYLL